MESLQNIELNDAAKLLFDGNRINPVTVKAVLEDVMRETVGPGGIATEHLRKGQSRWPKLADSTQDDPRKRDGRLFVSSGRVETAIESRLFDGKVREYGSSADLKQDAHYGKWRYSANGVYAQLNVSQRRAGISIGFIGTMKHSTAFNKARRAIAKEDGIKVRNSRSLSQVNIEKVEARLKGTGKRKFEAKGTLGFGGRGKQAVARGDQNLAYANIVQRGKFKGIRHQGGALYSAKEVASRRKQGKTTVGTGEHDKPRPLLPFVAADARRIVKAAERALERVFAALRK